MEEPVCHLGLAVMRGMFLNNFWGHMSTIILTRESPKVHCLHWHCKLRLWRSSLGVVFDTVSLPWFSKSNITWATELNLDLDWRCIEGISTVWCHKKSCSMTANIQSASGFCAGRKMVPLKKNILFVEYMKATVSKMTQVDRLGLKCIHQIKNQIKSLQAWKQFCEDVLSNALS